MNETSVQEQAALCYENNLIYLQNNHPELFQKVSLLDLAIDQGQYEERYVLEYMDAGYFDLKEVATGNYLYGENSDDFAKEMISGEIDTTAIKKAIFFGTGLGTHISFIAKGAEQPVSFLIIEDDLELFRLSLFVTNFSDMAQTVRFVFSVMENEEALKKSFKMFFEDAKEDNAYIPFFTFFTHYQEKAEKIGKWIKVETVSEETIS